MNLSYVDIFLLECKKIFKQMNCDRRKNKLE